MQVDGDVVVEAGKQVEVQEEGWAKVDACQTIVKPDPAPVATSLASTSVADTAVVGETTFVEPKVEEEPGAVAVDAVEGAALPSEVVKDEDTALKVEEPAEPPQLDLDYYEEKREVDWSRLSLETKVRCPFPVRWYRRPVCSLTRWTRFLRSMPFTTSASGT